MIFQCVNTVTLKNFILKHFLIITEVVAVALAFAWPYPGSKLADPSISLSIVALIFLSTGLKLKTDELKSVYKSADVLLVCCVSSLLVTALVPNYIALQLPFDEPSKTTSDNSTQATFSFGPSELQLGIMLFNCAPATIATGIIMVTEAEGDAIVAIAVSTITNIAGCFVTPLTFSLFVDADQMKQDSTRLILKIALSLLLPLFVGKVTAMLFAKVRAVVASYKKALGLFQSVCICLILWIKLSSSIYKGTFSLLSVSDIAILIVLILVFHLLLLLLNLILSISFCFKREQIAVMLLLCSQKTLVLTAAMATALPDQLGDTALILLPCFIAHPMQMLVDSFLIQPLKRAQYFPLCLPPFCEKCRQEEDTREPGETAVKDVEITEIKDDVIITNPNTTEID